MSNAARCYLLSTTIALVAMVSLVGWIDWSRIARLVLLAIEVFGIILGLLLTLEMVIGIPVLLMIGVLKAVLSLFQKELRR